MPLNVVLRQLVFDLGQVPLSQGRSQLAVAGPKIRSIVGKHFLHLPSSADQSSQCQQERVYVQRSGDFQMDGASDQTGEETTVPFFHLAFVLHHNWPEVVCPYVRERRR